MKNVVFMVAGLALVIVILVITFLYDQPEPIEAPVIEDLPVVTEPEPEEEPVFVPEDLTSVKVFFSNSEHSPPDSGRCEDVYAIERDIEPTPAIAKEALDQLLAGVTDEEVDQKYFTNINSSARVVSVAIENGVATVTFTPEFENGLAGACRVTAVRAQVEQTLLQFPTVQSVIIKVEGVPDEEVLQP